MRLLAALLGAILILVTASPADAAPAAGQATAGPGTGVPGQLVLVLFAVYAYRRRARRRQPAAVA